MIQRILFGVWTALSLTGVAGAQSRQLSMTVIQKQCIDFKNVKRESGDFRDCKVSEFGRFGAVGGRTYYYALYCIIPSYVEAGSCGDSSFAARSHRARGLAVFVRNPASARAELLFERVSVEISTQYSQKPEIIRNQFGTLLYLPIAVDGTGHMNESEYYLREGGKWKRIEAESWLTETMKRVPPGLAAWKGVWPDLHTMRAEALLYRSNDTNCCPSGGVARVRLSIRAKKFVVESVVVDTTTLLRTP
jgi:hypothetical protein